MKERKPGQCELSWFSTEHDCSGSSQFGSADPHRWKIFHFSSLNLRLEKVKTKEGKEKRGNSYKNNNLFSFFFRFFEFLN